MKKILLFSIVALVTNSLLATTNSNFTFKINGLSLNYTTFSWFAMPGDTLSFSFTGNTSDQFVGQYSQGKLIEKDHLNWKFVMPEKPGHYLLTITHNNPPEKVTINLFVKTPSTRHKGEYLNGYRIGNYPQKPFRDNPKYLPPNGFVEVNEFNQDTWVSPHFQLKQFLCKQQPDQWPKYLLLDPLLLVKLEMVIDKLNERGLAKNGLFIMSGYRTPYYNAAIGNGKYSRHIYGDAADVYVDEDNNSVIDDLNRDGKASMADAEVIYQIVVSIGKNPKYKNLIGGLGKYKKTSTHTWDVHMDTRGYKARW